jgi:hypothetical protein
VDPSFLALRALLPSSRLPAEIWDLLPPRAEPTPPAQRRLVELPRKLRPRKLTVALEDFNTCRLTRTIHFRFVRLEESLPVEDFGYPSRSRGLGRTIRRRRTSQRRRRSSERCGIGLPWGFWIATLARRFGWRKSIQRGVRVGMEAVIRFSCDDTLGLMLSRKPYLRVLW